MRRGFRLCRCNHSADEAARVARLSLEVQRAEDIRAVKKLQIIYAQYAQFGLWSQMWFSYPNPVSGRLPPLYCPNLKTCEKDLEETWRDSRDVR